MGGLPRRRGGDQAGHLLLSCPCPSPSSRAGTQHGALLLGTPSGKMVRLFFQNSLLLSYMHPCIDQEGAGVRTEDAGMPRPLSLSRTVPQLRLLKPCQLAVTSPNCGYPSRPALTPLMQRPQELSRPRRTAGGQRRTHSPSKGGPCCPEAKLGSRQPWAYLSARGSRDHLPAVGV